MQAGRQIAVLLHRQAHIEKAVHRRQEAINPALFVGEAQLRHAAHDFFFQLVLGRDFGLHKQVAVFFQQRGQFVAAQTTAIEHGNRVAPLIGQMLDDDEREQRQTLRGLVDLRCGGVGHEVIKPRVSHTSSKPSALNRARY